MKPKTHILNWRTVHITHGRALTLCGREYMRALGQTFGVEVAENPNDATCWACRKIRDGR